jgi:hypothetical protein
MGSLPDPKVSIDPFVVEAWAAPLPRALVLERLALQPELEQPAKLVLSGGGEPALLAEVAHRGDPRAAEPQARDALRAALAWIKGDGRTQPNGAAPIDLAELLASLPWGSERREDGSYYVSTQDGGVSARLLVQALGAASLRVSSSTSLKVDAPSAGRALPLFALEVNRRLRLARLSVTGIAEGSADVVWDAVLHAPSIAGASPDAARLEQALLEVTTAVAGARGETLRTLRALGTPRVAETYMRLRAGKDPASGAAGIA